MSFETIIGLEIHAELKTKSKIFCSCSTEFGAPPNEHTCPICLGLPGTLPVMNEEVINLAIKAGSSLNCRINNLSKMDRKNYFYPDLPKAYQISQYDLPVCSGGYVEIESEGITKKIRLNRIHVEEDAGKLVHLETEPYSLIDYNRVGVPLIEIVSEPDLRSVDDAVLFLRTLKSILEYEGISDCKMEQGSLRCDANISIRKTGAEELTTKVEIKNINSFRELQKALEKEEKRQRELYTYGEEFKIIQETRRWSSGKGKCVPMRSKEDAHDYRYFPDPDLVPVYVSEDKVKEIKESLTEFPKDKYNRFISEYKIGENEAGILIDDILLSSYLEKAISLGGNPKSVVNWILGDILKLIKGKEDITTIPVPPEELIKLINLINEGKVSSTQAKEVFEFMFNEGKSAENVIQEKGFTQISTENEIEKIISQVLADNEKSVQDYKSGKKQAFGFLMGQVMKASKGKVNPAAAKKILEENLI
ncbi:MAG: Asp-tRNA(Asn)/Glu-tRNA(Gln) amidotransferase subunit GatB [Bacillota bacterium]|nr:Asp-tRNA(Asn)/Glu-tRNA(Gln) amidotransferase subunit GatB [Bacillota bacterium]